MNEEANDIVDARDAAESVGLVYVDDASEGFSRRKSGKGWTYRDTKGGRITDKSVIERINKIGIPPAYTDVWISPSPRGHVQATGRDAKGRKQYRYHERFRETRDSAKYEHMLDSPTRSPPSGRKSTRTWAAAVFHAKRSSRLLSGSWKLR